MIARRWPGLLEARGIKVHPAAKLFPVLAEVAPDQFRELADDIKRNGIQQPLVFWTPGRLGRAVKEKYLLDGCTRLDALETGFGHDDELFAQKLDDEIYIDAHNGARLLYGEIRDTAPQEFLGTDPWDFVVSANLRRRHLSIEGRKAVAADLLKRRPERSNRQIGGQVGLDHKTIGGLRAEKERRGEIPHVSTRTDTAGRQQPASKPPPEPGKEAWRRQIREQQAPPPAPASDNSAARLRSVAFTLSGNIGPSENIDLTAARNGLREQGELEDVRAKVSRCLAWLRKVEAALGGGQ